MEKETTHIDLLLLLLQYLQVNKSKDQVPDKQYKMVPRKLQQDKLFYLLIVLLEAVDMKIDQMIHIYLPGLTIAHQIDQD